MWCLKVLSSRLTDGGGLPLGGHATVTTITHTALQRHAVTDVLYYSPVTVHLSPSRATRLAETPPHPVSADDSDGNLAVATQVPRLPCLAAGAPCFGDDQQACSPNRHRRCVCVRAHLPARGGTFRASSQCTTQGFYRSCCRQWG